MFNRRLPGSGALSGSVDRSGVYHGYVAEPFRTKGAAPQLPSAPSTTPSQRLPIVRVHMTPGGPRVTGGQVRVPVSSARTSAADSPRTSLQLVEDCARLRAEVDRLRQDNQRLADENARLRGEEPIDRRAELDDSVQRFKLLELE